MFKRTRRGPFFNYWHLSYREKFFRTLWMFPFAAAFFLLPADFEVFGLSRNELTALVFIVPLLLAGYTFYRWKTQAKR